MYRKLNLNNTRTNNLNSPNDSLPLIRITGNRLFSLLISLMKSIRGFKIFSSFVLQLILIAHYFRSELCSWSNQSPEISAPWSKPSLFKSFEILELKHHQLYQAWARELQNSNPLQILPLMRRCFLTETVISLTRDTPRNVSGRKRCCPENVTNPIKADCVFLA